MELGVISDVNHKNVVNDEKVTRVLVQRKKEVQTDWKRLLSEWGIPYSLIHTLEEEGWTNPLLWDNISNDDLENIGFNKGHITLFRTQYNEYKTTKSIPQNTSWKNLLKDWDLPQRLIKNMQMKGWINPIYWNRISYTELQSMGFDNGHIIIFNEKLHQYNK
eukprot:440879_1